MSDWIANSIETTLDSLDVVEVDSLEDWESISFFYKRFSPELLLGIFPSHLQLDLRFYRAVRSLGMSSVAVAQEQMQAGVALIEQLSIGGIVTTAGAYRRVRETLHELSPNSSPYIQVVLGVHESPFETTGRVFFEVHNIPGLPLLYQCDNLTNKDFHPTKRFSEKLFPRASTCKRPCSCGNEFIVVLK